MQIIKRMVILIGFLIVSGLLLTSCKEVPTEDLNEPEIDCSSNKTMFFSNDLIIETNRLCELLEEWYEQQSK